MIYLSTPVHQNNSAELFTESHYFVETGQSDFYWHM